jgi:DNA-binding transcriptional regulator YdaS (Cro superfamily)
MALVACKECGNEISDKAKACPKCGAKNKRTSGCLKFFVWLLIIGLMPSILSLMFSKQPILAPQTTAAIDSQTKQVKKTAPQEFRGLKWDEKPKAELGKHTRIGGDDDIDMYSKDQNIDNFLGVPVAEETYTFSKKKFFRGDVYINGTDNYAGIKNALINQYGSADKVSPNGQVTRWNWPSENVMIQLYYQEKFKRTTVTMGRLE